MNTFGTFRVERIILQAGRILFIHDLLQQSQALISHLSLEESKQHQLQAHSVLVYPRPGAFSAYIQESSLIHLQKQRQLELVIKTGESIIHKARITIRAASAGLWIYTATAATPDDEDSIKLISNPGEIQLQACAARSTIRVNFPYKAEYTATELFIKIQIKYHTDAGEFIFKSSSRVDITVPLDVSVQDTIKQESILSRFWLRSVTERPLLVLDVELEPSKKYQTRPLLKQNSTAVVSNAHPLCVSYRVEHVEDMHVDSPEEDQPLVLRIKYRNIAQDLVARLAERLRHDLADSPHAMYAGMLLHSLHDTMHIAMNTMDFKQAEMNGKVQLPPYASLGTTATMRSLYGSPAAELRDWVRNWYNVSSKHDNTYQHQHY